MTGAIEQWIEVGRPGPRALRGAAGRSREVHVHAYGRSVELWWAGARAEVSALPALTVWRIAPATSPALAAMAQRTMRLQCLAQDGDLTFSD